MIKRNFKVGDYVRLLQIDATVQLGSEDEVELAEMTSQDSIRHARPDEIKTFEEGDGDPFA